MYKDKKIALIIAAAGIGSRMGAKIPKQFLKIDGVPILKRTMDIFCNSGYIDGIVIVTNKDYINTTLNLFPSDKYQALLGIAQGGDQKQDSISNGLRLLATKMPEYEYVLIHDAARPFVTKNVIENSLKKACEIGASTAAVPVKDTIRHRDITLERKDLYIIQTPQAFERSIIEKAYAKAYSDGYYGTDDAGLVERLGLPVAIADGDYANIKITTREDLPMEKRVGTGFDVHCLTEGRDLILGGERLDFEKGLLGHSDADVLVHAIMDALLGAAALGDIGKHFPDTDPRYKGISSLSLLEHVGRLLAEHGYKISNIDACLMAQRPKILPYIDKMRVNIANTLGLDIEQINIKATTTEKLGFVGREEGMAAEAICMIEGEH